MLSSAIFVSFSMKSAAKSQHRQKFSCRAWNSSLSSGTSDGCRSAALEISSEKRRNSEVSLVCWGCAGVCWEGFGHDQTCHFSVLHVAGCFLAFLFALRPRRSLPPPLTTVHSPDSTTDRSPSLLPRVQRSPEEAFKNKAKRKKEECEPTTPEDTKRGKQEDEVRGTSSSVSGPIFKEPPEKKVRPGEVRRIKSIKLHFELPVLICFLSELQLYSFHLSSQHKGRPSKDQMFPVQVRLLIIQKFLLMGGE